MNSQPVRVLFPAAADRQLEVPALVAWMSAQPVGGDLAVGDDRVRDFLLALSRRLLRPDIAHRHPELGSLGFFLRRSELDRMVRHLRQIDPSAVAVPRGVVLQFPPANVDTIFAYSWALSALAGNRNVVRISDRSQTASAAVLAAMSDALAEADPAIAETQRFVAYDRDDGVTGALCAACDVRVIWGGDGAVQSLRRFAIPPLARDVAFPDRSSSALISAAAWHAADVAKRGTVVEGFATDVYWFDQAACSSPRNLIWVGTDADTTTAQADFFARLGDILSTRGWNVDASMAVEKRISTYELAATGVATEVTFISNAITVVTLSTVDDWQREWLGAGTICQIRVDDLGEVAPAIRRKDQTLTQFGFSRQQLESLIVAIAGRGVDRIVPFGQALAFSGIWDGLDLGREFTRIVTIQE